MASVSVSKFHIDRIGPKLEPECPIEVNAITDTYRLDPQISIAISLKRIADAIAPGDNGVGSVNLAQTLGWELGRSFEQGRRTDR